MNTANSTPNGSSQLQAQLDRRRFLRNAGLFGAGAVAAGMVTTHASAQTAANPQAADTVAEILTAALIAEDLATTFYYNVLTGPVLGSYLLAGSGGGINNITNGSRANVQYLQAALTEEINHANLLRSLLGGSGPSTDPVQTFYFPPATFSDQPTFSATLDALENAFIGAYLTAVQEFALLAATAAANPGTGIYSPTQLEYFAKVAASIMGVECEHRVLGRVISRSGPAANNRNYEQTDGLTAVYNGPSSAVVALTPFLTPSNGSAYNLADALAGAPSVGIYVNDTPPAS
jgi:hypothetical protein